MSIAGVTKNEKRMILKIDTPVQGKLPSEAVAGVRVEISGIVYTARDAVMPKITRLIREASLADLPMNLKGAAIMHTAFSPAGFGPTSSNKEEIEDSMGLLSEAGVKIHLGKGAIAQETVNEIAKYGSIFIVVPPVSALLQSKLISKKIIAFEEEGMEAVHELVVSGLPGVIAAANGQSVFRT